MSKWIKTIHHCDFVEVSNVFEGLPLAWDRFVESNPPFSWGDNNRTLVTASSIALHLDDQENDDENVDKQVKQAIKRLFSMGETYVDLEN